MDRLLKIARSASPDSDVLFRKDKYGSGGIRSFLRDVLAMANASVHGPRYIVVGAEMDKKGRKHLCAIDAEDFSGDPPYQSLANEYIEPPVRMRYKSVSVEGKRVGVFEIDDSQDRPYMMRIDYSETLRRGDAYMRHKGNVLKMGRRHLLELFEKKFRDSISGEDIEIGFPGEIIHKNLDVFCCDLSQLPSAVAGSKLHQLIEVQANSKHSGSTTAVARLTHARLFGADSAYVDRSPTEIMQEIKDIRSKYRDEDDYYLFEAGGQQVQLVVYNQGEEPLLDASLTLVMPNHNALYVAEALPKTKNSKGFVARSPDEIATYPAVTLRNDAIQVSVKVGDIPAGEPVDAFDSMLRVCVGNELAGKRFGMRYSLHAQNLRAPATGQLKFCFKET